MERKHASLLVGFVLAVGFLVMFLSSAIKGLYQVYFVDLAGHFGQGRSEFALSGTLFVLTIGLASPVVGALSDRIGPMLTVTLGSLCAGIVFLAAVLFENSIHAFIIIYGLLGAFALAAMTYVPMGILVDRLVPEKSKAFAYAIVTNGTAIGFILLSPLWIWLEKDVPWQNLFVIIGLIFAVPITAALYAVSRVAPLEATNNKDQADQSLKFLISDARFYILAFSFISCGATMAFIDVHLVPYWQGHELSRTVQASSLSLLGVLELSSGLLAGWLATRYNKGALLSFFYFLRFAAVAMLLTQPTTFNVYTFAILFGASYLGTVVLTSAFCFDFYGGAVKGKVFGLLFLIHQLGALVVTQFGAMDYDQNQSYQLTAMVMCGATALAGLLSCLLIPMSRSLAAKTAY